MYKVIGNKILIDFNDDFNPMHILECGQIFRYEKENDAYIVYSKNEKAKIIKNDNGYEILCTNSNYFVNFFDLGTDYHKIKSSLLEYKNEFMDKAIDFGKGIRILKQDPFEMIISFIISANNNIPRIKGSIAKICSLIGDKVDNSYYAFPTIEQLASADESFFKSVGLGYRASYMVETCKMLKDIDIEHLKTLNTPALRKELMKLKGIGRKVADCIMLFGFGKLDVFPIDTWTNKVYMENFYSGEKSKDEIANYFVGKFKNLSGYAQQYFYYWKQKTKN